MRTLDDLGLKHGTDKASVIHDYLKKYQKYLPFKTYDHIKILEIGVQGGESLRMWKDWFYNAEIVGIDINPECKKHEEENITIEIGNQTDTDFIYNNICKKYKPFDLIIDDGSHINNDVIFSFESLFHTLSSGGVYVIEDCCTSYWEEYGGGFGKQCTVGTGGCATHGTMIEHFKRYIDSVNYYGIKNEYPFPVNARREDYLDITQKKMGGGHYMTGVESINFLNSLIIITKK